MISMSRCGCVGNPVFGATRSSLTTRSERNPIHFGSQKSEKLKVCLVLSQPWFPPPRSALGRIVIMYCSVLVASVNSYLLDESGIHAGRSAGSGGFFCRLRRTRSSKMGGVYFSVPPAPPFDLWNQ